MLIIHYSEHDLKVMKNFTQAALIYIEKHCLLLKNMVYQLKINSFCSQKNIKIHMSLYESLYLFDGLLTTVNWKFNGEIKKKLIFLS